MKKIIPILSLIAVIAAVAAKSSASAALDITHLASTSEDESIPYEFRVTREESRDGEHSVLTYSRGGKRVLVIRWRPSDEGAAEMYSGTVYEGEKELCGIVHLYDDRTTVIPRDGLDIYKVWFSVDSKQNSTVVIMKEMDLFEIITIKGRGTSPISGRQFMKEAGKPLPK